MHAAEVGTEWKENSFCSNWASKKKKKKKEITLSFYSVTMCKFQTKIGERKEWLIRMWCRFLVVIMTWLIWASDMMNISERKG